MALLDRQTSKKRPRVFLSSAYREISPDETGLRYFGIRQRLHALGDELEIPVWVHECVRQNEPDRALDRDRKPDWIVAVEECLEELSRSDLVIVVLGHRAGTRVVMGEAGETAASVLEAELFYANLKRIPVVFFALRGYEPDPELSNLIEILELRRNKNWIEIDENDIYTEVKALLTNFHSVGTEAWRLRFFHDRLARNRSFSNVRREIYSHELSFIGRFASHGKIRYNPERFKRLLGLSDVVTHKASQLGFLWMA